MASTEFELSLRVMVFTLTIAIATMPTCADHNPFNAVTTYRLGKDKLIVKTILTPSPYHDSKEAEYSKNEVDDRSQIAVKPLNDDMETVTSDSTSRAARCSFEETMAVDLGALLDAGEGALVTLVAGETRLTAHRAVLIACSPTFASMLCNDTQDASSGQVAVADVEGPVLRQLLAYIYTLQAPKLPGMAPKLLAAADMFGLSALKSECEAQVAAQLVVENAAATAVLAIRHSSTSLRQAVLTFIKAHQVQVVATRGWADAACNQPEEMTEVYRLLSKLPVETSSQNASLCSTPAAADSQPITEAQSMPHSSQGQTLVAAAADSQPSTEALSLPRSSQEQTPVAAVADSQPTTEAQSIPHSSQGQTLVAAAADSQPSTEAPSLPRSSQEQTPVAATADSQSTTEAQSMPHSSQGQTPVTAAADSQPSTEAPSLPRSSHGQTPVAATADSQPTTEAPSLPHSSPGQTPATTASPLFPCHISSPDDDAVARLRSLSSEEKGDKLIQAARKGRVEQLQKLLAAGADVKARDFGRWTALHHAAWNGDVEVARRLVGCGAVVDARDKWQATPLHWAAQGGHAAVVRLLVAASADPNARDYMRWTPLHYAAARGHAEVVAALLEAGADRWSWDSSGKTPLDRASWNNRQQLIQLLT